MFGGKKEKALEEQLQTAKEKDQQRKEQLQKIIEQQEGTQEQFARITASRAQTEQNMQRLREQMKQFGEFSEGSEIAAVQLHSWIVAINNAVETFDVNHSVFLKQKKQQDEKIMEVVENNKHFTTPMKYIAELPAARKEEERTMRARAQHMTELSKNMTVLSLNAAIEAGRMGEAGSRFVATAEEIRSFSEEYGKDAADLLEQLDQAEEKNRELEEQIHHLNGLLRENNISMTKLLKESMMSTSTYEVGQLDLKTMVSDPAVGRADVLMQSEKERLKIQKQMQEQLGNIGEEQSELKNSVDELEAIFKSLYTTARAN